MQRHWSARLDANSPSCQVKHRFECINMIYPKRTTIKNQERCLARIVVTLQDFGTNQSCASAAAGTAPHPTRLPLARRRLTDYGLQNCGTAPSEASTAPDEY